MLLLLYLCGSWLVKHPWPVLLVAAVLHEWHKGAHLEPAGKELSSAPKLARASAVATNVTDTKHISTHTHTDVSESPPPCFAPIASLLLHLPKFAYPCHAEWIMSRMALRRPSKLGSSSPTQPENMTYFGANSR